ncbi:MAG: 23S rRNA (uracil(1939)-C(5))-methyltransferase RlmD [bacterium]
MKEKIRLELTDLAVGGEAVGKKDGLVYFVPFGIPGDEVEVELEELKKSYARGKILEIVKSSPHRIEPRCPIFSRCGGCHLQHIEYSAQLDFKRSMVENAMKFLGNLREVPVKECIGAADPWFYRNKVQLVAASKPYLKTKDGRSHFYLGLYARRTHQVVKMDTCAIQHRLNNRVIKAAGDILGKLNWEVYDEKTGKGQVRHIISRVSASREEALVVVVSAKASLPQSREFIQALRGKVPQIKGIAENLNSQKTNVVFGSHTKTLWGRDHIVEDIDDLHFKISATSFFQVNPEQHRALLSVLESYLEKEKIETAVDAYCGVGALSLWLARRAGQVIGIDENQNAISDAQENAVLNSFENITFYAGRVEKVLSSLSDKGLKAGLVVLDPPRKGCEKEVLLTLAAMKVPDIIYISCNPATLARDLALLSETGYRVLEIQPIDMFPQTAHVECVARICLGEERASS